MTLPHNQNLEAAIFDFDHTLVELGKWVDWSQAMRRVLTLYQEAGVEVEKIGAKFGFSMVRELDAVLSRDDPARSSEVRAEAYQLLAEEEARGATMSYLMPGAAEALDFLGRSGLELAIVSSNSTWAIEISLEHVRLAGCFSAIVGRTPTVPLKPDPAMFYRCLTLLSLSPGQVVAVGDSPGDMRPAARLGMLAVGVIGGQSSADDLRRAGAEFVIDSLEELPVLLTGAGEA